MANITLELRRMICNKNEIVKKLETGDENALTIPIAYLLDNTSILEPTFRLISDSGTVGYWRKFNYLHCPNLGRWYYITDIIFMSGGVVEIHCKVDVLMSYSDLILDSTQVINRSEHMQTPLLIDEQLPFDNGTYTSIINIDCPHYFSNHVSYLLKIGGGYSGN